MSDDTAASSMDAIIASIRDGLRQDNAPAEVVEPESQAAPAPAATPAETGGTSLEALVRSALEPVLKTWLDANLPEIVDRAARDEIARLIKN